MDPAVASRIGGFSRGSLRRALCVFRLRPLRRGDPAGFVQVEDERTLLLPERRGNNRIDSLRNIVADPRGAAVPHGADYDRDLPERQCTTLY